VQRLRQGRRARRLREASGKEGNEGPPSLFMRGPESGGDPAGCRPRLNQRSSP
jgi:hypothetical protein